MHAPIKYSCQREQQSYVVWFTVQKLSSHYFKIFAILVDVDPSSSAVDTLGNLEVVSALRRASMRPVRLFSCREVSA